MQVKDLIEKLKQYDPELKVLVGLEDENSETDSVIMDISSFLLLDAETQRLNEWGKPDVIGKVHFNFKKTDKSRQFLFINTVTQF